MKKVLSILLCLSLVFSFSASAMATDLSSAELEATPQRTEILSKRDAYSKTYLLPNGTYEYVGYAEPIHYKDSDNNYVEINNEITEAARSSGYKYTNTANSWNSFFSEKISDNDAVMIRSGDFSISFSLPGQASLTSAVKAVDLAKETLSAYHQKLAADNRAVLYKDVANGVDIAYTVLTGTLKEDIILKNKNTPNSFAFRLTANGLILKESGSTFGLFTASDEEIFTFAPLYMEDANGKRSENVTLSFSGVKNGYEITITADPTFLNAADTAYPVVIDPSIMVTGSNVTYDTCVDQEYPTSNYYLSENLWTGGALGTNAMRTYMKFTLPSGISASQVTSAYVCILKKEHQVPTIKAYRITSDWSSSSVTWNAKPSFTTLSPSGTAFNSVGDWYRLDVTTMVKNWLNGTYYNYGMVLKEPNELDSSQKTKFYSSDAPSPNKPELLINYSAPTINVELLYDQAYNNRFSGASAKILREANILKNKYATEFGINVNFSTPTTFYSYADSYCTTSPYSLCTHVDNYSCENSLQSVLKSYHHTNIFNMLYRIPRPNLSEFVTLAFIGHNNCVVSGNSHITNPYYGLCNFAIGVMSITNFSSEAQETKTFVHEFGHLYNVEDHYGNGTKTTTEIIQATGNTGYNRNCIYGENKDQEDIYTNLIICDGCASLIIANKDKFSH